MSEPRRRPAVSAMLLTLVGLELLRVLFPTAALGSTAGGSPTLTPGLQLVVAALLVGPFLGAVLIRRDPRRGFLLAAVTAGLARAVVLVEPTGVLGGVAGGIGIVAVFTALVALAAGAAAGRVVRVGVVLGAAAEALVRTATGGYGLVWSASAGAQLLALLVVAALLLAAGRTAEAIEPPAEVVSPAPWTWWWLLPMLVLTGVLTSTPGRVAVATGWPTVQVAAAVAAAHVLAAVTALAAGRLPSSRAVGAGAALTTVGTAAALTAAGWPGVLGPIATAVGLAALAGTATNPVRAGGWARALHPAGALAGSGACWLGYYLLRPTGWNINTRWLLLASALLAAALGAAMVGARPRGTLRPRLKPGGVAWVVALGLAATGTVVALAPPALQGPAPPSGDARHLTVATLNIGAGFSAAGRFDPRAQGALLREHEVDVVLLTEVDRGWWLTGGQDPLPELAAALGLPHLVFAPATDEVRGHALLSRYPITEFTAESLPSGPGPSLHSQLVAVVTLADEQPLGVVGTQLSGRGPLDDLRLPQARSVAGSVARLRERGLPTVVLGDLGPAPEGAVLDSFAPLLDSALPEGATTVPGRADQGARDQVLLSPDLRRSTVELPASEAALRNPVVVTVERREPVT